MSRAFLLLSTSLVAFSWSSAVSAQQAPGVTERLTTVTVEGEARAVKPYRFADPLDSGTSTFDPEAVEANTPGSGDVNQLLKALPTAQFSLTERLATREDLQDIRPEQTSISGGRPYDNLFTIDGVAANSLLDTTNDNPFDFNEVSGGSPQTVWLDSSLVGSLIVRDSNVSAEFGGFTGGVVEIKTREPRRAFGMTATGSVTDTAMTSFKLSDGSRDRLAGDLPPEPEYEKVRWGASVDLPVTDWLSVLIGYNRSTSSVVYQKAATYGGGLFGLDSRSDNYLVKAQGDLPAGMKLGGQISFSPYESQSANANGINNLIVSKGGGLASSLDLSGSRGAADWSLHANYSASNTDRDSPENNFSRPSAAASVDYCAATNCTEGGFGSIRQRQNTLALKGDWSQPLRGGDVRLGFDLSRVEAQKQRLQTNRAYQTATVATGSLGPNVVCASATDPSCVTGDYALTRYQEYRAYDARVDLSSVTLWAEQTMLLRGFDVRLGLRYDHESFLDNHTLSPRLSISHGLPWGFTGILGVNRYYGRSFLGYAIREQYPDGYTYGRTAQVSGAKRIWSENWTLSSTSRATRYSGGDLNTPYSDELTLALSGRVLGGELRLRGVLREGRDEFARSASQRLSYDPVTGGTSLYTSYTVTNSGETDYQGGSLEYVRDFGRHTLSLSTNLSKTRSNAENYLETADDDLFGQTMVVYEGQVVSLLDVLDENQRLDFAAPFIANSSLNSVWWNDRIKTSVNARFRTGFEQIDETGETALIDGVRYDVYGVVEYDASITLNANASIDVFSGKTGSATLDVRVDNLLDAVPNNNSVSISQPYQLGRVVWVGLKYRY